MSEQTKSQDAFGGVATENSDGEDSDTDDKATQRKNT